MAMCMKATRVVSARPVRAAVKCQASVGANIAKAAALGVASLGLALSAQAATVEMGTTNGSLIFTPDSVTVSAGETVTFVGVGGGPHNVVFAEVPAGVSEDDADALGPEDASIPNGQSIEIGPLSVPGTYKYVCGPHQTSGMKGEIVVVK